MKGLSRPARRARSGSITNRKAVEDEPDEAEADSTGLGLWRLSLSQLVGTGVAEVTADGRGLVEVGAVRGLASSKEYDRSAKVSATSIWSIAPTTWAPRRAGRP